MKNLFKKQSERNLMIDQGHISIIKSEKQSYYNGEEIKIGEQVLVAIVEVGENNYKTINLNTSHFNKFENEFEIIDSEKNNIIPIFKIKTKS